MLGAKLTRIWEALNRPVMPRGVALPGLFLACFFVLMCFRVTQSRAPPALHGVGTLLVAERNDTSELEYILKRI